MSHLENDISMLAWFSTMNLSSWWVLLFMKVSKTMNAVTNNLTAKALKVTCRDFTYFSVLSSSQCSPGVSKLVCKGPMRSETTSPNCQIAWVKQSKGFSSRSIVESLLLLFLPHLKKFWYIPKKTFYPEFLLCFLTLSTNEKLLIIAEAICRKISQLTSYIF